MRILGIDYGDRRIGLALSDPLGIIASPLKTYERQNENKDKDFFRQLIAENQIARLVIGLPINMDGSSGERAKKTKEFGDWLKDICPDIIYKDERLSSVSANKVLDEAEIHWSKRKQVVDGIAAQIILQAYLDKAARGL